MLQMPEAKLGYYHSLCFHDPTALVDFEILVGNFAREGKNRSRLRKYLLLVGIWRITILRVMEGW